MFGQKETKTLKLKRELYAELSKIKPEKLTDAEVNIMYELSQDKEIQSLFKS